MSRLVVLLVVLVLVAACGGSGGSGTADPETPRGPWAGTWLLSTTPPGGAFSGSCTGTFPPSRYPLWTALGSPAVCGLDALAVRQDGAALTIEPETFLCEETTPDMTITVQGSGHLDGPDASSGDLTREVRFPDGSGWSASYHIVRSGPDVTLFYFRSDAPDGSCTITPLAPWSATIAP